MGVGVWTLTISREEDPVVMTTMVKVIYLILGRTMSGARLMVQPIVLSSTNYATKLMRMLGKPNLYSVMAIPAVSIPGSVSLQAMELL